MSTDLKEKTEMEIESLKKLIDPANPLMDRFKELAPGSFKHCQNVSNLVEAVALELELDVHLMKVCGMLHDVGKMYNAKYFTENQDEKNPHDELDAFVSYQLITRHVADTVLCLAQIPEVPKKVLEIVSEHHGDTILLSIFTKSDSQNESMFRYKSSKPQSIESAVLMIVDGVEATARAFSTAGKLENSTDRKKLVDSTIQRLIDDEQLDELKIGNVRRVKAILVSELDAIYHKRISYDEKEEKKKK